MRREHRIYRAHLLPVWDQWVVEVPEASGVHAMIASAADAEEAARRAIIMVLGIDPASFSVVIEQRAAPAV